MILGVIADDFTGASDVAAMLSRGGMVTELLIGVPTGEQPVAAEAGVVALKSRSIASGEAIAQSLAALDWDRIADIDECVHRRQGAGSPVPLPHRQLPRGSPLECAPALPKGKGLLARRLLPG